MSELPWTTAGLLLVLSLSLAMPAAAAARLGDPTRPTPIHPRTGRSRGRPWRLDYTLVGPGRRVAVINGSTVAPGQRVAGARLLHVGPGRVVLRYHGHRLEIRMSTGAVKRPARQRPSEEHGP